MLIQEFVAVSRPVTDNFRFAILLTYLLTYLLTVSHVTYLLTYLLVETVGTVGPVGPVARVLLILQFWLTLLQAPAGSRGYSLPVF